MNIRICYYTVKHGVMSKDQDHTLLGLKSKFLVVSTWVAHVECEVHWVRELVHTVYIGFNQCVMSFKLAHPEIRILTLVYTNKNTNPMMVWELHPLRYAT